MIPGEKQTLSPVSRGHTVYAIGAGIMAVTTVAVAPSGYTMCLATTYRDWSYDAV